MTVWRDAIPPVLILLAGGVAAAVLFWRIDSNSPPRDAIVIKVCRDGTLVLRDKESFFIVRPGAQASWAAVGADVCMP